jgi:hypothetical protein
LKLDAQVSIVLPWTGKHLTEEHRKKIALAHQGKPKPWLRGRKLSKKRKEKMSQRLRELYSIGRLVTWHKGKRTGLVPWNKGTKLSPEICKHFSDAQKKRYAEKGSLLKGKKTDRTLVEKQIAGRLRYYKTHDATNKGIPHSPETRKKISKAMKEYWNSRKQKQQQ